MRKLLFAATLVFILGNSATSKAQGNLQFNQVIVFDIASGGIQAIAVPANKVWKIESTGTGASSNPYIDLRNASAAAIAHFGSMTGTAATANYPFWLPSGFTGSFLNSNAQRSSISIIEFNIVP